MPNPGEVFTYNGGASALIGRLIAEGTGMGIDAYANEKLFVPLGIAEWEWLSRPDGVPLVACGLRLKLRDLAKFGQLVLDRGMWEGRRLVPAAWLDEMVVPRPSLPGVRYGYFWWLGDAVEPRGWIGGLGHELPGEGEWPAWIAGIGNGGQRLSIQPDIGLVVATFAGDYNNRDDWVMPIRIMRTSSGPSCAVAWTTESAGCACGP